MKKGFIFMIDAFLALMIVVFFLTFISHQESSISPLIDESLYGYGSSIMDILTNKKVMYNDREISLIHVIESDRNIVDDIVSNLPSQYNVNIEAYEKGSWKTLYSRYRNFEIHRAVSVVAVIPIITEIDDYDEPYGYGSYCHSDYNVCIPRKDMYKPAKMNDLDHAYVRVVVSV